ncbi:MAG TPA: hypothetical protein VL949_14505, partial [Geobacteraceae bacterium]|nr:hypothetical protein [Geobacteraceae bacterium]
MTGTVILFAIFSTLMVLSVLNRRWLMLAILLVGGFPLFILCIGGTMGMYDVDVSRALARFLKILSQKDAITGRGGPR